MRCTLCCYRCFTPGTLSIGPKVIDRQSYHTGVTQATAGRDAGRHGHMADAKCKICRAPLCYKKARFPGNTKSCWEIFHSQTDLYNGECHTLCHVENPRVQLGVECTDKGSTSLNAVKDYSKKTTRKKPEVVGYGGRVRVVRESRNQTIHKKRKPTRQHSELSSCTLNSSHSDTQTDNGKEKDKTKKRKSMSRKR
jgi:hypothetical protein